LTDDSVEFWVSIGFLALCLLGWLIYAPWSCHSRWDASGMRVSWGPIQGCMISKDGNVWIPSDNYRDID